MQCRDAGFHWERREKLGDVDVAEAGVRLRRSTG